MLVSSNAVFFVYFKIYHEVIVVVTEDVIDCLISSFEGAVESNELSVDDGF